MQWNRQQLLEALRVGSRRARAQHRNILVSVGQPTEPRDLLHLFTAAQAFEPDTLFFWEHTEAQPALLGIGTAAAIEVTGPGCLSEAASQWRSLFQDAVIWPSQAALLPEEQGPVLFGGFAFDPLSPRSPLWDGFPDGLLLLPAVLIRRHTNKAALHLQAIIGPADNIEQAADETMAHLERLQDALNQGTSLPQQVRESSSQLSVQDDRPALEWMELIRQAADQIERGAYRKVVLARSIRAAAIPAPFSPGAILQRLRASQPAAYRFAIQRGPRCFVGATPEQLAQVQQGKIQTMALAGSAPLSTSEDDDARIDSAALWSAKNREEHAIVVEMIREALAQVCSDVWGASTPQVLKLKTIQHLQTPIYGTLRPGVTILDALAALHPTPAVGGLPGQAAREMIRGSESLDRGWYAGPIGWIDQHGDGEFAVALRSALVHGSEATLFAGCGIVASSDPMIEYAESCLKFQTMLAALSDDLASAATWLPFASTIRLQATRSERYV